MKVFTLKNTYTIMFITQYILCYEKYLYLISLEINFKSSNINALGLPSSME